MTYKRTVVCGAGQEHARSTHGRDSLLKKKSFQKVSEMSTNRRDMRAKIFYFVVIEIHELMYHRTSAFVAALLHTFYGLKKLVPARFEILIRDTNSIRTC